MPMTPRQLRTALKKLDVNQVELAGRLGVTPRAVRFWLAGKRGIPEPVAILVRTWVREGGERPGQHRR